MSHRGTSMLGSRIFVAVVFTLLALAFVVPTLVIYNEYGLPFGHALAAFYGHTFLYFATFGIVALVAFYSPSVVFVDFYWNYVEHGRLRFIAGSIVVTLLSVYLANLLFGLGFVPQGLLPAADSPRVPAIFELSPQTLTADRINASQCGENAPTTVVPLPHLAANAVCRMQQVSRLPLGFSTFVRRCPLKIVDALIEPQREDTEKRYCFALDATADAATCCEAQKRFRDGLAADYAREGAHSATLQAHLVTLPFKVFFMLVVLIIGVLLAVWQRNIDEHYAFCISRIENGVLIGATAILFWPIANQAFLQAATGLFGSQESSAYQSLLGPAFSIAFCLWALLILFFFFRHNKSDVEQWVRMIGAVASVIAVIKYDAIVDRAVTFTGVGAFETTYPLLMVIGLVIFASSFRWPDRSRLEEIMTRRRNRGRSEAPTADSPEAP